MKWNAYPPNTRFLDLAPYQREQVLDNLITLAAWLQPITAWEALTALLGRVVAVKRFVSDDPKQPFESWMGTLEADDLAPFTATGTASSACICVDRAAFPNGPRQDGRQVGTRFGDAGGDLDVFLDGEKLLRCVEAYAGDPGWTIEMLEPLHPCGGPRGDNELVDMAGVCLYRRTGSVEIRTGVPA